MRILIVFVLHLTDQQRRISQAKGSTAAVAYLRIACAGTGRVAIEQADEQREVFVGLDLQPDTGRCQRPGGVTVRQVVADDRRPTAGEKDVTVVADKKFRVGGKLPDAQRSLVLREFLLEPYLE